MVKDQDYKRKVTHTEYTFMNEGAEQVGIVNKLNKEITDNLWKTNKEELKHKRTFRYIDDQFIEFEVAPKVIPLIGGGVFLIIIIMIIIGAIKFPNDTVSLSFILWSLFSVLGFSFFTYYYFTMPPKETIYNRQDGLVTFPGFMWKQNITMSIRDVEFAFSQPSAQGIGAYQLRIVRPDKIFSQALMSFGGTCYEDLSFWLWYMDKNRPLPPGDAFDEFRDRDFERRKAAGFPKPMFPARFPTPEATPEQQAERKRIGGW